MAESSASIISSEFGRKLEKLARNKPELFRKTSLNLVLRGVMYLYLVEHS